MKSKQFKTSKGTFLIVDMTTNMIENMVSCQYLVYSLSSIHFSLKNITEDEESEIIDKVMNEQHFQNYNYKCITDRWAKSARESLKSLIESLGIHLYENPINIFTFDEDYIKHIEAEANTFYNPYIFKIAE